MNLIGNTRTINSSFSNPTFLFSYLYMIWTYLTLWVGTMKLWFLPTLFPKNTLESHICLYWLRLSSRFFLLWVYIFDMVWISSHDLPVFASHELDSIWFKLFKSFGILCLWSFQVFDLWHSLILWLFDILRLLSSFVNLFEFFKPWLLHAFEPWLVYCQLWPLTWLRH